MVQEEQEEEEEEEEATIENEVCGDATAGSSDASRNKGVSSNNIQLYTLF